MRLEQPWEWVRRRLSGGATLAGLAAVLLTRLYTLPKSLWEEDEFLFVRAVTSFEPLRHHPHPPGYPLLVGLGKLLNLLFADPFVSLVVLAVISSLVGYLALVRAFCNVLDGAAGGAIPLLTPGNGRRELTAVTGALLFFLAPAMLVHSTLPMSDPPALMFLALALLASSRAGEAITPLRAVGVGACCAAAIGCRPQLVIAVAPMFAVVLWQMKTWRDRAFAAGAFALVALAWLVPLALAVGGTGRLLAWETAQAHYAAAHDAALSRSGRSWPEIFARFVAHPWGPKWLAAPLLAAAGLGAITVARARVSRALPLLVVALVNLGFCVALMDPADGARYSLPSLPAVAFLAAVGIARLDTWLRVGLIPVAVVAAFAIGSGAYVWPFVHARATTPSAPVQAARHAVAVLPPGAVVFFEPALRPHAEALLTGFSVSPVNNGWAERPGPPFASFALYADRRSAAPGAAVFEWPDCDAYRKLTRNHYRVVSLVPLARESVYRAAQGLFPIERDEAGREWRWLAPAAALRLPDFGCRGVRLTLELDRTAPFAANTVALLLDGRAAASLEIPRGQQRSANIELPGAGVAEVAVRSARSYVPAEIGLNRDPRRLAIKLIAVEQLCQ